MSETLLAIVRADLLWLCLSEGREMMWAEMAIVTRAPRFNALVQP